MKKLLILLISGLMVMTSCKDDTKAPIITFDQAGKGAYVKLLNVNEDGYDLNNFSTTAYDYDVEFVDEQQGDLVSNYTVYVSYKPSPFSSTPAASEVLYASVDAGSFTESEKGFKSTNLRIPLTDVASKLGLNESQLGGADRMVFRSEITLTDGSVFQASNSSAAVNGSAFAGHFNFNLTLACPLEDSQFVGAYTLTHVSGDWAFGVPPFGADPLNVTMERKGATKRSFQYVHIADLGVGNGAVDFTFEIICDKIIADDAQLTGLGCGGDITMGSQPGSYGSVDVNDDSTLTIDLVEWQDDGGCGVPVTPLTIRLDKQ